MINITFSFEDTDHTQVYNLLGTIRGIKYQGARPISGLVGGNTEHLSLHERMLAKETLLKQCLYALQPKKGIIQIPENLAKLLDVIPGPQISILPTSEET
jgi:hypothetical protein